MDHFRSEGYFLAAKAEAKQKGKVETELESDEVVLSAAYQKALGTETDQIQMADFVDLYGEKQVKEHQEIVDLLKKRYDAEKVMPEFAEGYRLGKILEAIVTEQIELNEWLGPNANTQQTCEYDDFHNGIDFITEFNEDGALRHMGFAIDATHGKGDAIKSKLLKIRIQLSRGELGQVFYFQSSDKSTQGRKRLIPKIVLAVDKKHLTELARLWVKGEQKALSEHPIKNLIIQEVIDQLEAQLVYVQALEKEGNPSAEKLVAVLSSQCDAMKRLAPGKKEKRKFVDAGAKAIQSLSSVVFSAENAKHAKEDEVRFLIKQGKQRGEDVSEFKKTLGELQSVRAVQDVERIAKDINSESDNDLRQRHKELSEAYSGGDTSVKTEMGIYADELGRRNKMRKFSVIQAPEENGEQTEMRSAPTSRKELNGRFQELLRLRASGNKSKSVLDELNFLNKEFARLNVLNRAIDIATVKKHAKPIVSQDQPKSLAA